jgi:hypothetical protein
MRSEYVDERDSTWELHDPRFRLLLFEGPGAAVTAVDIADASVDEALESARELSGGDERLWALALVGVDARGARGLTWLSGMDYNDAPGDAVEWRRRREMQDRYLAARSRRGQAPVLPDGRRLIRVFPEWSTRWPLWESFTDHYLLDATTLDITAGLDDDLTAWNAEWQRRQPDEPLADPDGWRGRGLDLVARLRRELDGSAEVRPEFL